MAAGWSYRWLGSIDTALSMFRDAAKFKPTSDEPQVGIASALLADGQLAEAEKAFGEALSLNVGSPPPITAWPTSTPRRRTGSRRKRP